MIHETYAVAANDYKQAGAVSSAIKKHVKAINVEPDLIRRISIACYEAEINMIIHSDGGEIDYTQDDDWIRITFSDVGPGIPDITQAMTPGWSTADETAQAMGFGAGLGLTNIQKNADTFELDSTGSGTCLKLGFRLKGAS